MSSQVIATADLTEDHQVKEFRVSRHKACTFMCLMLFISSLGAAEPKPRVSVDLLSRGMRSDFFAAMTYHKCPYQYPGYRSVQWLDEQRILVAFNTTPDCAQTEGVRAGNMRLGTFDTSGQLLHSTDASYDAGEGLAIPALEHDGIWIGPNKSIVVEIPGKPFEGSTEFEE